MSDDNRTETASGTTDAIETREWLESLDWVIENGGPDRVRRLL